MSSVSRRTRSSSRSGVVIGSSSNEKADDINDSEVEKHKELYYKVLQLGDFQVRGTNGKFKCPFCLCKEEADYEFTHLLQHAFRVAEGSISLKQRAKHYAMARYLAIDLSSQFVLEAHQQPAATTKKRSRVGEDSSATKNTSPRKTTVQTPPRRQPRVGVTANKLAMAEKREKEALDKIHELESKLSDMTDDINALIAKERASNDELHGVRKELIKGLGEIHDGNSGMIGIKKFGELDSEVFVSELYEKFPPGDIVMKGIELCSKWQEKIKDSHWYPFQIVEDDTGKPQRLLETDDIILQALMEEWGGRIHDEVVKALTEVQEHNPSGCYMVPELWNFSHQRNATLVEVIRHIFRLQTSVKGNNSRAKPQKTSDVKGG